MRKLVFLVLLIISVVLFCGFASGNTAYIESNIYYEVHNIKSGDTLWDIALLYSDGSDVNSYVEEIMSFNNMKNQNIQAGHNIIIPVHRI